MGQGADRDEVDAGLGGGADGLKVDVAGGLEGRLAAGRVDVAEFDRGAHRRRVHVVEEELVGAGAEGVGGLVEVADLDLHRQLGMRLARRVDGLRDAARGGDVVLLDQEGVEEAHAVIGAAARRDRRLLQLAQARRRLAGVEDARRSSRRPPRHSGRSGSPPRRGGRGSSARCARRRGSSGPGRGRPGSRPGTSWRHSPSAAIFSTSSTPVCAIVSTTRSSPKTTPGAFWTIRALAVRSAGTVASPVTSPSPRSSASARATSSRSSSAVIADTRHPSGVEGGEISRRRDLGR